jgi:arylsulfatase A-like enzyme/endonuclease/exonuclease/phosphatase family metal-dependent hydrolase
MMRFQFRHFGVGRIGLVAQTVLAALAVMLGGTITSLAAGLAERPNIVFILADDLGWGELGCYGQEKIRTPNIDRLAAEGMRFTQHYSGAPVCAPSRCVLMTGLHSGHAEIRGNKQASKETEGQWPISENALTIAEVLKQAGYVTGACGKWGLGPVGSTGDPNRQGFDFFFGYNCQAVAHSYFPPHLWRNQEKVTVNGRPVTGHAKQPEGEVRLEDWQGENYAPKLILAEALKFIDLHAKEPFFLYLPFIEPHVAMQPPKRLVDSYPASWDSEPYRGQSGYLPHPRPRAAYAAMITELDEHVGAVLEALKKHGLEEQTLVVFTSDNGTTHRGPDPAFGVGGVDAAFFNSTRGLRGFKGSVYEGGLRVPLIVRWPGQVKAGSTSDFPSYFADHFATLCDALELTVDGRRDGESLLPILKGATGSGRRPMVWVFPEYGGQVAVRIGEFKVVRQGLARATPGNWEVYNIALDPGETNNIAKTRSDVVAKAVDILGKEADENRVFPVKIPGVGSAGSSTAARDRTLEVRDATTIRVMSYNIRIGAGGGEWPSDPRKLDVEPAARVIAMHHPDLAGLQEVDRFRPRSAGMDQPALLRDRLKMNAVFTPAYTVPVTNAPAEEYGVALLSAHPVGAVTRFPLYKPEYRQNHPEYPDYYSEQRVLLHAPVVFQGRTVHVFVTHLGLTTDQRERQIAQIAEITARYQGPKILMGDFNAEPGEPAVALLRDQFQDALEAGGNTAETRKSFPAGPQPRIAIDYIFVSKDFEVASAQVVRDASLASDHNPVIAELRFRR